MHVVATAGHVDHGKSTLVRALTGMEPDRFEEERRRGLTIELGYAWTTLNGGEDTIAFVDVPGHERFFATMLAGLGPVVPHPPPAPPRRADPVLGGPVVHHPRRRHGRHRDAGQRHPDRRRRAAARRPAASDPRA